MPLVLGMDVGGTSSRAVLLDEHGMLHGSGVAGGGNPVTGGEAVGRIAAAARDALAGTDVATVAASVLGIAGGGVLAQTYPVLAAAWCELGLRHEPREVGDALLGFAAGTGANDGTVLIAGTGAIAARIRGRRAVRYADGHGWLLGDRGSGVWLGRCAVRHLLDTLDRGQPQAGLAGAVADALGVRGQGRAAVYAAVYPRLPGVLAGLAPLVLGSGDEAARRIRAAGAEALLATAELVRALPDEPLVLAGGLLTAENPLSEAVRAGAALRWPHAALPRAGDGALAAAWLGFEALGVPTEHGKILGCAG